MKKRLLCILTSCLILASFTFASCDINEIMNAAGMAGAENVVSGTNPAPGKNNGNNGNNGNNNGNNGNNKGDNVLNNSVSQTFLGQQPHALYTSKMNNAKKADNFTVTVDAVNRITLLGTQTTTEENFTIKFDGIKFSADMLIHEDHFEQKIMKKLWCVDGYLYTEDDVEMIKESVDEAYIASQIAELKANYDTYLFDFTEAHFAGSQFTIDQNGAHLSVDLTSEEISDLMADVTGVKNDITAQNCKVDISFDLEGNVSGYVFELDGTVNAYILHTSQVHLR